MIRPILFLLFVGLIIYGTFTLIRRWRNRLDRSLKRRFRKMRKLILKGIDSSQKDRAKRLLANCETFLDMTLVAYERLQELREMQAEASELVGVADHAEHHQRLERKIRHSMEEFLSRLYLISSEATFDWQRSLDQLEEFTEELEDQRKVFLDLNSGDVALENFEIPEEQEIRV